MRAQLMYGQMTLYRRLFRWSVKDQALDTEHYTSQLMLLLHIYYGVHLSPIIHSPVTIFLYFSVKLDLALM